MAPGNFERRKMFAEYIENKSEFSSTDFFQTKYIVFLALAILFVLLGMELKNRSTKINLNFTKLLFFSASSVIISIIITYTFQHIALNGNSVPLRGWTFTSFLLCSFFCFIFVVIGYWYNFPNVTFQIGLKIILPFFILVVLFFAANKQYSYVRKYADAYDKQIDDLLLAKKNNEKVFYYSPLPNSGMLTYLYMGDYRTEHLKIKLELDFDFDFEIKEKSNNK